MASASGTKGKAKSRAKSASKKKPVKKRPVTKRKKKPVPPPVTLIGCERCVFMKGCEFFRSIAPSWKVGDVSMYEYVACHCMKFTPLIVERQFIDRVEKKKNLREGERLS